MNSYKTYSAEEAFAELNGKKRLYEELDVNLERLATKAPSTHTKRVTECDKTDTEKTVSEDVVSGSINADASKKIDTDKITKELSTIVFRQIEKIIPNGSYEKKSQAMDIKCTPKDGGYDIYVDTYCVLTPVLPQMNKIAQKYDRTAQFKEVKRTGTGGWDIGYEAFIHGQD